MEFFKKFVCEVCKTKFKSQEELDAHAKTHSAQQPTQVVEQPAHAEIQAVEKPVTALEQPVQPQAPVLKCEKCGATFATQAELDEHVKTHESQPPATAPGTQQ